MQHPLNLAFRSITCPLLMASISSSTHFYTILFQMMMFLLIASFPSTGNFWGATCSDPSVNAQCTLFTSKNLPTEPQHMRRAQGNAITQFTRCSHGWQRKPHIISDARHNADVQHSNSIELTTLHHPPQVMLSAEAQTSFR